MQCRCKYLQINMLNRYRMVIKNESLLQLQMTISVLPFSVRGWASMSFYWNLIDITIILTYFPFLSPWLLLENSNALPCNSSGVLDCIFLYLNLPVLNSLLFHPNSKIVKRNKCYKRTQSNLYIQKYTYSS